MFNKAVCSRVGAGDAIFALVGDALSFGAGYTPPELGALRWFKVDDSLSLPGVRVVGVGVNNWIVVSSDWRPPHQVIIDYSSSSSDNVIVFDRSSLVYGHYHFRGAGAIFSFSETLRQPSLVNVASFGRDELFFWGKGATSNGVSVDTVDNCGGVIVGDDCMFAKGVSVRTSDQHAIFDMQTKRVLNDSASVIFEPHVWVGQDAMVLKGSKIGLGSVVAARSVVNGVVPRYSMVGGVPARLLRAGVSWDRSLCFQTSTLDQLNGWGSGLSNFDDIRFES